MKEHIDAQVAPRMATMAAQIEMCIRVTSRYQALLFMLHTLPILCGYPSFFVPSLVLVMPQISTMTGKLQILILCGYVQGSKDAT